MEMGNVRRVAPYLAAATVGLALGYHLKPHWPQVPLHAVATHGGENFAVATGPVDESIEAFYVLDYLTGDLRAAVINNQVGRFLGFFDYNILQDFAAAGPIKNPEFLMVTGLADVPRGFGRQFQSRSVVYVTEVTTGQVVAYFIPWNQTLASARRVQRGTLIPLDRLNFRTTELRDRE
jgi:hypothetical protein